MYLCYNEKTMRADRLLSMLMLLQVRGRITAEQLAEELETSVRTVYRDIEALSAAGVPVYTQKGPGGGCKLLDGYRTSLTGLTPDEVKALFMLSVPAVLDKLGLSDELRGAMRKLAAALPENRRGDEEKVRQRLYLDWTDRPEEAKPVPQLQSLYRAVKEDEKVTITCTEMIAGGKVSEFRRTVEPYGLVAKSGGWHLVCAENGKLYVYNVADISGVQAAGGTFKRPPDFKLESFWKKWCAEREEERVLYSVKARVSPGLFSLLHIFVGEAAPQAVREAGPPDKKGWLTVTLRFNSFWDARKNILNMGRDIEVLEPEALKLSVIDFACQITDFYEEKNRKLDSNHW